MRVINGIECIGTSPRGRGCCAKDFDVRISHQEDGTVSMRIKKADIVLSGKTFLLGFANDKMYFIPFDGEGTISIHAYGNRWYLRTKNPELIEKLKDVKGCYTAHYSKTVKAWYIVPDKNKEEN